MSETPLPQPLIEDLDERSAAPDSRARRRSVTSSRPVSAFAPVSVSRGEAQQVHGHLTQEECSFVSLLHEASLCGELDGHELTRSARLIEHNSAAARRLDLLDAYYDADGDPITGQRRIATDRWFMYRAQEGLNASQIVARALNVLPELNGAHFERVGGADGALVLRAGDHVCAIEDEADDGTGVVSVSVRDVVRSINVLLERHDIRVRLVGLIGDGQREAYVGVSSMAAAVALVESDCLAAPDTEALIQLTAW
jgi:hypothetical protein